MEKVCEFCGESRPIIYCKADAACLCLSCDARVHSANALFKRHLRALLCENCGVRAASIHCLDHRMFVCRGCDRNLHVKDGKQHQKRVMSSYGGCPSAKDFAVLWGYDLNEVGNYGSQELVTSTSYGSVIPGVANLGMSKDVHPWAEVCSLTSEKSNMSSISIAVSGVMGSNHQREASYESQKHHVLKQILDLEKIQLTERKDKFSMIREQAKTDTYSSKAHVFGLASEDLDQSCLHTQGLDIDVQQVDSLDYEVHHSPSTFYQLENFSSSCNSGIPFNGDPFWQCRSPAQSSELWSQTMQDLGICEENDCVDGLQIPEVDLTFQNFEELFSGDQDENRSSFDDTGMVSLSMKKDASIEKLNMDNVHATKDVSAANSANFTCKFVGSVDFSHSPQPACSSFSLSRFSADTTVSDYLDTGFSPNIMKEEPPCSSTIVDSAHSEAKGNAMKKYNKKKKVQLYEKRIKYASRKARADVRKRVKGQFVKSEGYDSDSINVTKSY